MEQLELFRLKFPLSKVMMYEDYMVYKVGGGMAQKAAQDAQKLIKSLNLNLIAVPSIFGDSFEVKRFLLPQ